MEDLARETKRAARMLAALGEEERTKILMVLAQGLRENSHHILEANKQDLEEAKKNNIEKELLKRLALTPQKITILAKGIESLARQQDPVGRVLETTQIAEGLVLRKTTVPLGVLLVIFESRPDSLPQICALSLKSGNGLLLKGGKEAHKTNTLLHKIVLNSVEKATNGRIPPSIISYFSGRSEVAELLKMDSFIDVVIPRGSGEMVKKIKSSTKIPVLGHAEGVCHLYIDKEAEFSKAKDIAIDAKTDYPAACNALETLLLHQDLCEKNNDFGIKLLKKLEENGVIIYGGPKITKMNIFNFSGPVESFKTEYGVKSLSVEVVSGVDEAMDHINLYGSSHTEVIVTQNKKTAQTFLKNVDSACVFWNSSSRFADGFRFGLGAEVGISTGRIHARGPVGVEGLLSTKWTLISDSHHIVNGDKGVKYTHKSLSKL